MYHPLIATAKAVEILAACAKTPETKTADDINVAFAIHLARRPRLASMLGALNGITLLRDMVLAEAKVSAVADSEVPNLIAFFDKLDDLIQNDLGDILCAGWSAEVDLTQGRIPVASP